MIEIPSVKYDHALFMRADRNSPGNDRIKDCLTSYKLATGLLAENDERYAGERKATWNRWATEARDKLLAFVDALPQRANA